MSQGLDDLGARKELLIAQSAVQRARLRYEIVALRSRAKSRLPLFSMFMLIAGGARAASWIGKAAGILAVVRAGLSAITLLRR